MQTADITVVIVNWNGRRYINQVLEALHCQTLAPDRIVVIDNASTDGSPELISSQFPQVRLRRLDANIGFAAANNLAFKEEVHTTWVALLNPDAIPETSWIDSLHKGLREFPGHSAYGSRMRKFSEPNRLDGTGDCYHPCGWAWRRDYGVLESQGNLIPGEIFSPCAAAGLYRLEDILEVGGFDEDFFCYFEDVDLGFRLRLAGKTCFYLPQAVVSHVGSGTTGAKSDFAVYYGYRNLIWCYFKNMPTPLLWRNLFFHLGLNLALLAAGWRRGQMMTVLKAQIDAMKAIGSILAKRNHNFDHVEVSIGDAMERNIYQAYCAWRTRL